MFDFVNHEKFRNILTGVQSLIIAIGIIVGGLWTAKTFDLKKEAEIAKVNYEKAERELREKRVVNISINPSQMTIPNQKFRCICSLVEITNVGNHPETLDWNGPCFRARKIDFDDRGSTKVGPATGDMLTVSSGESVACRVAPGEMIRVPCLAKVDESGLYYLRFTVNASAAEQQQASEEGQGGLVEWSGSAFFLVQ